ncbi:hypothetical protein E2I00_006464, partial [Balaenoptera physalus]
PKPRGLVSSGLVRAVGERQRLRDADAARVEARAGLSAAEGPPQPPRAPGPSLGRGGRRAAAATYPQVFATFCDPRPITCYPRLGKMTQFLPPNLLALFAPRDPIPYLPPLEKLPHEKHHNQPYCGIAPYIREFEDPRDAPPPTRAETREERMERKRREKIERRQQEVETELKMWDPHNDPNAQGDAFKTLFVARVNYDTTESKLRREFEVYGPIKRIHMVYSKRSGKPRGYAFIEYEHERDMHCLRGGLGGTRRGGADVNIRHSGRDDTSRYDER